MSHTRDTGANRLSGRVCECPEVGAWRFLRVDCFIQTGRGSVSLKEGNRMLFLNCLTKGYCINKGLTGAQFDTDNKSNARMRNRLAEVV